MMQTEIRVQILRLRGEMTLGDVDKVQALVSSYIKAGRVHVLLNLENVPHFQEVVLPPLGGLARRLREYGGDLKLVGVSPYLQQLFDLAGCGRAFDFCPDEDLAAQHFRDGVTLCA